MSAPYLSAAVDALVAVERDCIAAAGELEPLRLYRWQPSSIPDLPALWNWIDPSASRALDTATWADDLALLVRLALRHTDSDDDMRKLEIYGDAVTEVMDRAFMHGHPGGGPAGIQWANRTGMRMAQYAIDDISMLGLEFPVTIHLQRRLLD